MKITLKYLSVILSLLVVLTSCDKEENVIYFEGGTAPVLAASRTGTLPLSFATSSQQLVKFTWTNPEYKFTTGVSSQDVTYILEVDTTGANFTNPKRYKVSVAKDLEKSFTVGDINDIMLNQLGLDSLQTHNIEVRVTSTIGGSAIPLSSNVIKYTSVKPYSIPPKVVPPGTPPDFTDGKLYITGDATPGNWMGGGDPELVSQRFTRISKTLYQITINLTGGKSYLFVPVYGNWNSKFGFDGPNNANNVDGDNFKAEGGDMKAPAASGPYKIEVDFQRGKFTVTKL
jgi:starch-binding outer membrane protein SusE/F